MRAIQQIFGGGQFRLRARQFVLSGGQGVLRLVPLGSECIHVFFQRGVLRLFLFQLFVQRRDLLFQLSQGRVRFAHIHAA